MSKTFTCCLCNKITHKQWGNNPYPLKDEGKCCDNCNFEKVIPVRLFPDEAKNN